MSGKATTTSLISVVLVTDASLTIAGEWHRILSDCVGSIIHRLMSEIHSGSEMRMGYVAYGAAEGPEGPIVDKRYFQDHQSLTRDLTTKHTEMGIGRASGTCEIGLSALEAYACALEMFDLQRQSADFHPLNSITLNAERERKTYDRHDYIIHIGAAEPDDARRPRHNDTVAYDELNWDTLPSEIKKHNIHLCMNLLKPIKRFNDLFDAVSEGPRSTPWFTTPPKHTLLLYGFPAPRNKPPKRSNAVEGSPVQKRPRKDVPSPSSPAKANSNSSPYMSPAAAKTPKQAPAVPKPPTPVAPLAEPKSTPVLNAAQPPAPVPAPMPALSPAPPAPPPAPPVAPAPVTAPSGPSQMPRGLPTILGVIGFHKDIRTHPRFEAGLQNPQQRMLVEFMLKYDPIYTNQMIQAAHRKRAGQPDPADFNLQMRKLKLLFDLGAAALRQWNAGGPAVNFDDIKSRANSIASASPAPPAAAQGQTGQGAAQNSNLGPAAKGMLDQMNEISKSNAQRQGMLPPAGASTNIGVGARPPSQPAFPQQQPHMTPSQPPANPLAAQNRQRWTGSLIVSAPKPDGVAQLMRVEVIALHQAMGDPMMSTWPKDLEMRIMFNLSFAPKDLDTWLMGLKNRGRSFSIVRIQPVDNPAMRESLARAVGILANRQCLGIASWTIGARNVPTAIFTRMPAGQPENHLIAIVFAQHGFDKSDLPPHLANAQAQNQSQGSPQQNQNANANGQMQQQPSNIGMTMGGRVPSAQEIAAMQKITQEMNIPWDQFQRMPDADKMKVVHVWTNRQGQMRNNMMGGGGGAGAGMRPGGIGGMQGAGAGGVGLQMQQLQQQQQRQQQQQQQMQAALLNRAGVPPGAPANAFAGLSASGAGFAGMGGGNNLGGLNPGISVGALGGMQPQGANTMGGSFPMSQDQINSWMQRSGAPGR